MWSVHKRACTERREIEALKWCHINLLWARILWRVNVRPPLGWNTVTCQCATSYLRSNRGHYMWLVRGAHRPPNCWLISASRNRMANDDRSRTYVGDQMRIARTEWYQAPRRRDPCQARARRDWGGWRKFMGGWLGAVWFLEYISICSIWGVASVALRMSEYSV
jgi:hypothetical protein